MNEHMRLKFFANNRWEYGPKYSFIFRYGVALVVTGATILIKIYLSPVLGENVPFLLSFSAVAVSALYGGFGPGILATIILTFSVSSLFIPGSATSMQKVIPGLIFFLEGLIISTVNIMLRRAENITFDNAKRRAAIAELGQQALAGLPTNKLLSLAAEVITRALAVNFVKITEVLSEPQTLIMRAGTGWNGQYPIDAELDAYYPYVQKVINSKVPLTFADFKQEPTLAATKFLHAHDIKSGAGVAIRLRDGSFGVLSVFSQKQQEFTAEETYFLESVANIIAQAIIRQNNEEELRKSSQQLSVILGGVADGITAQLPSGRLVYANNAAARMCGFTSSQEMLGAGLDEVRKRFQIFDEQGNLLPLHELPGQITLRTGEPTERIIQFALANGKRKWSRVKSSPILDERGVSLAINIFRDITHNYLERQRLERTARNQNFLARSAEILTSSLDYETTLRNIARLAVPEFADWCAIYMLEQTGKLRQLLVTHVDPNKIAWAEQLGKKYPPDPEAKGGVYSVIRNGRAEMLTHIPEELLVATAKDEEHLNMLRQVGLKSYIAVPLTVRGQTIGAITFIAGETNRRFDQEEFELAQDLARRASLAIDNSQLYQEAQTAARNFQQLAESMPQIVWTADRAGQVEYSNQRWFDYTGLGIDQANDPEAWLNVIHPEDFDHAMEKWNEAMRSGRPFEAEVRLKRATDNTYRWHLNRAVPVRDDAGQITKWFGTFTDIDDQKKAQETIRYQAFHDNLTGLPNRKLFNDRLVQTIKIAERQQQQLAVLFLDLDRFKNINDTLGHGVGDKLLKETAQRLSKSVRSEDTVARLGGDEFIILLAEIKSSQDAVKVARKILKSFRPSFIIDDNELHITTSIGIALYPADGNDAATLTKHADTALYRAKEAGRNNYQLYNKTMGIQASERLRLENELRIAIANNELVMYYQPIVELSTGKLLQAEALIRWSHPDLGMIYPNEFIPLAEETGMIVHMGGSVFRMVGKQVIAWRKMGLDNFRVGVNLSGRQFAQPNVVERIASYLSETRADPSCIELEITESLAMHDVGITIEKLQQLKKIGVGVAIDDFGTGYSSLSYLKRFPIDIVKVDRSFIQHCINDAQDAAIIKAIISMAHSLNLKVVAEGVETEEQKQFLAKLNCDAIQGYLISPPMPAVEFTRFIRKYKKTR
jgi:diguanylate cyclase (GGDEF)-like protein/PAS domain S-box-containing protein